MNRRALELTSQLNRTELGPVNEIGWASVQEVRLHIHETLDHRKEADISERFELSRFIFEGRRKILARGFWLADRNSFEDSRIVIVLEEVGLRQEREEPQMHVMVPSPERNGAARRESAQRGSSRGVFDVWKGEAPSLHQPRIEGEGAEGRKGPSERTLQMVIKHILVVDDDTALQSLQTTRME